MQRGKNENNNTKNNYYYYYYYYYIKCTEYIDIIAWALDTKGP